MVRLRASSRELLVEAVQGPDQSLEPGHAGLRIALRLFNLLAEFLDLVLERRQQVAKILLAGFGEGL